MMLTTAQAPVLPNVFHYYANIIYLTLPHTNPTILQSADTISILKTKTLSANAIRHV